MTADAKLLPPEPTYEMLRALAGDPALLAASYESDLRRRYQAMRDCAPTYVQGEEKGPVAWLHRGHTTAYVITNRVKEIWLKVDPKHVENYTVPLYNDDSFVGNSPKISGERQ